MEKEYDLMYIDTYNKVPESYYPFSRYKEIEGYKVYWQIKKSSYPTYLNLVYSDNFSNILIENNKGTYDLFRYNDIVSCVDGKFNTDELDIILTNFITKYIKGVN